MITDLRKVSIMPSPEHLEYQAMSAYVSVVCTNIGVSGLALYPRALTLAQVTGSSNKYIIKVPDDKSVSWSSSKGTQLRGDWSE